VSTQPILEAKRRISDALLDAPGISGVGLRAGRVVIYLSSDDPKLRRRAEAKARKLVPDVALTFEVSGPFGVR
jgi:hypothetical protein